MKIIKEGKKIENVTMKVICKKCDAELEVDEKDLKPILGDYLLEDGEVFFFTCPCCNENLNNINKDDLSQEMRDALRVLHPRLVK